MARPRNNVMKLPRTVRWRICKLFEDGAEYDVIRNDPEVFAECDKIKNKDGYPLKLHNSSILAYLHGQDYKDYVEEFKKRHFEDAIK